MNVLRMGVALLLMMAVSVSGKTGAVITNCCPVSSGFMLEWMPGGEVVVEWSPDLVTPFSDLSGTLTDGTCSYTDTVHGADNRCFYRVEFLSPGGMVRIPAGSNSGTNPLGDGESHDDTYYPATYSLMVNRYYMDKYEVTNDEMVQVLQWAYDNGRLTVSSNSVQNAQGDPQELLHLDSRHCRITWNGSSFGMKSEKGPGYPCVEVSWYGAAAYCNYKSEMEVLTPCYNLSDWNCNLAAGGYRLPTGDEWEYAARGGLNSKRFPWGDTIQHTKANYESSGVESYDTSLTHGYHPDYDDDPFPYTSPVGSFSANGYGLYDMSGNLWEWCEDWYPGQEGSVRAIRGGSWKYSAYYARCGNVTGETPPGRYYIGFRAVRSAE